MKLERNKLYSKDIPTEIGRRNKSYNKNRSSNGKTTINDKQWYSTNVKKSLSHATFPNNAHFEGTETKI